MKYLQRKADKEFLNHLVSTKEKINVLSGECRYNFRCSYNVVNDAIVRKENRVAMCVYVDDGQPIIHFLNVDKNCVFTENTLGAWSKHLDYYLIKYIDVEDFWSINSIFGSYRSEVRGMLSFLPRFFGEVKF